MHRALITAVAAAALSSPYAAHAFTRDTLVHKKCAGCHAPDAEGKIARVEEIRTTPEEWTVIVDRMRRLHGMPLTKAEMDRLLKELCTTQILTPEEQARVSYLSLFHNSQVMEDPADKGEERLFVTCVRCHTAGKIRSYRMTAASWAKLRDFHLWFDPAIVYQMREMHWLEEAAAVLQELPSRYGYGQAFTAPKAALAGQWTIVGYEPGKGRYQGDAEVKGGADGEYTLRGQLRYSDRTTESFEGEATLYGGYALRTRTHHGKAETHGAYIVTGAEMTGENHFPAPRFRTSSATWIRKDAGPRVARVSPAFLLSGEKTTLTVEGVGLPAVTAADVAFTGGPVKVLSAKRAGPGTIELQVVASARAPGRSKLSVKGLDAGAVSLAPAIDFISVTPTMGRARLSAGARYPAEGVQFEAIAYARAKPSAAAAAPAAFTPDPASDLALGPVPAKFTLAEEKTREGDDDLRYVGKISASGSYVPHGDYRPVPARAYSVESSGLVKVLASYRRGSRTYDAEGQLAVTMPDFVPRIR
ncbi:MAG TPA: quinohemoprotein amine dehydrogenase subunit alpha [Anaeromyxobacteraceae bacterium]|nr:quinohemoprotein amine dehydrogenase subunit alpha [Anaeromyxobacteraceae bacterium]